MDSEQISKDFLGYSVRIHTIIIFFSIAINLIVVIKIISLQSQIVNLQAQTNKIDYMISNVYSEKNNRVIDSDHKVSSVRDKKVSVIERTIELNKK